MPSPQSLRRITLLLVCLFAPPVFAEAADPGPIGYLEYNAGISFVPYQNLTGSAPTSAGLSGRVDTETGFVVGGAIGFNVYRYRDAAFRTEIAVDYRQEELSSITVLPLQSSEASGQHTLLTAMANAYVDYDPEDMNLLVVPYVGFGVGYGRIEIDTDNAAAAVRINDEDSVFAWQVMTGVNIPYTETVGFRIGYRYVSTTDPNFDARVSNTGSTRFDSEFDSHEVTAGLRINF
jgi:opacity protein-like surface antigen